MKIRIFLALALSFGIIGSVTIFSLAQSNRPEKRPLPKNNSGCLVCHINFEREPIAERHLKRGITCARCHGVSYDHMNDEEAATKPDVLYGRSEVDPFCKSCHKAHKNPKSVAKFMQEWKGKRRPHGRLIRPNAICTDCHGLHRLPHGGTNRSGS